MGRKRIERTPEEMKEVQRERMRRYREKIRADPELYTAYKERANESTKRFWENNPEKYKKYCLSKNE